MLVEVALEGRDVDGLTDWTGHGEGGRFRCHNERSVVKSWYWSCARDSRDISGGRGGGAAIPHPEVSWCRGWKKHVRSTECRLLGEEYKEEALPKVANRWS